MTTPRAPGIEGLTYLEHLGSGGYSDVYLYERRSPKMKVAVKVLKDGRLSAVELKQFAAEAETMAELADHPYIVQVFSTGTTDDGRPYLVMKYYPPPNLGVQAGEQRFSVADVLRTGVKIASAVEAAHRAGILHRDIKPANILVGQYGEPGLTDFGIAGTVAETDGDDDLGVSIPWSPPEVLTGKSNGTPQSDVYSLGATLWHLLVGRSPFEVPSGDNAPRSLMSRILQKQPPATGRADVPASLDRLLQQAMAKNPSVRPRSALEFARALQAVEQEQRFARTDIVVDGVDTGPRATFAQARPETEEGRTRTRSSQPLGEVADSPQTREERPTTARPVVPRPTVSPKAVPPSLPAVVPDLPTTARPAKPTPRSTEPVRELPTTPARLDSGNSEPATTARPSVPTASGGTKQRERTPLPAAGPEATTRRPSKPAGDDADVSIEPTGQSGVSRRLVIPVAVAVVGVAVAAGVMLSSGDSSKSPQAEPTPTVTESVVPQPEAPELARSYDAKHHVLKYTWSGVDADYFTVSVNGDRATRVTKPTFETTTSDPAKVCISVTAYVSSGGDVIGGAPATDCSGTP